MTRLAGLLLVLGLNAGCRADETSKANQNVEASKALLEESKQLETEARKYQAETSRATTPEALKESATRCAASFQLAIEKYDEAARLTKEAAGFKVSKVFAEYLDLKSQQFAKYSAATNVSARACRSMTETGTTEQAIAGDEADQREWAAIAEEVRVLSERAAEIERQHADQFKPTK